VPGIDAAWVIIGILEFAIFLLILVSIVRREFLPQRRKSTLLVALALALLTYACLSFGQTSTGNTEGTASLYTYFASTAVIFLLVLKMPPNGPPDWLGPRDWRNRDTARR
jgi:drug/metabolite transporter (DMT)-like permease